jgi:hypothetical protein
MTKKKKAEFHTQKNMLEESIMQNKKKKKKKKKPGPEKEVGFNSSNSLGQEKKNLSNTKGCDKNTKKYNQQQT